MKEAENRFKLIVNYTLNENNVYKEEIENILERHEYIYNILIRTSRLPRNFSQLGIKSKQSYIHSWTKNHQGKCLKKN